MKKRILSAIFVSLAAICLSELVCFVYLWMSGATALYWSDSQDQRKEIIDTYGSDNRPSSTQEPGIPGEEMVIHPYVGFSGDPLRDSSVNQYGFRGGRTSPIQRRSSDTVIIGIVGGDVAEQFFIDGMPLVTSELNRVAAFADKQFVVVNLACHGYKQPQQLMAINYMLALGAEFDIIINIDGFNEVALHEAENAIKNVTPIYPRNWYLLGSHVPDPFLRRQIGHQEYLQSQMAVLARTMSASPLRYSATWNAIWRFRQRSLMKDRSNVKNRIRTHGIRSQEKVPYWITGPQLDSSAEGGVHNTLAFVWAGSSLQLDHVCRENGTRYFHFLQPSQYVADSKPIGPEERAVALVENHPYQPGAVKAYPSLVGVGRELARQGVRFTDLTQVFAEVPQPLYIDPSSGLAKEGHEIIARNVAQAILDAEQ